MRAIKALERRLTGHKTSPSDNPTSFVQLPWNGWTFERTDVTDAAFESVTISVSDIRQQITVALGLEIGASDLRIKVHSAQTWCTVTSTLLHPDISTKFYELVAVSTDQYPRETARDLGTLNKPAKIGYNFPSADRREIMGSAQDAHKIVETTAVTAGSAITTRVQVLWQSTKQ